MLVDAIDYFFHVIEYGDKVEVVGVDVVMLLQHDVFDPFFHARPEVRADQDDGDLIDFFGLYEGEYLKKLVHCAEAPRKYDKGLGILHKHHFAGKEVVEHDVFVAIDVGVGALLKRQLDIEADTYATFGVSAFAAGFHNAWPAACDDAIAFLRKSVSDFDGLFVVRVVGLGARRSKYGDTRADFVEALKRFYKLRDDFKHRPRVFSLKFCPFALWLVISVSRGCHVLVF